MRRPKEGTHEWVLDCLARTGGDPYEGLDPEEKRRRLSWDTRQWINRRISRITRSEPSALYLNDIPTRRRTAEDFLAPGETLDPYWPSDANEWPTEVLIGTGRSPAAIRRAGESSERALTKMVKAANARKAAIEDEARKMAVRTVEAARGVVTRWATTDERDLTHALELPPVRALELLATVPLGVDPEQADWHSVLLREVKSQQSIVVTRDLFAELSGTAEKTAAGARMVKRLNALRQEAFEAACRRAAARVAAKYKEMLDVE